MNICRYMNEDQENGGKHVAESNVNDRSELTRLFLELQFKNAS